MSFQASFFHESEQPFVKDDWLIWYVICIFILRCAARTAASQSSSDFYIGPDSWLSDNDNNNVNPAVFRVIRCSMMLYLRPLASCVTEAYRTARLERSERAKKTTSCPHVGWRRSSLPFSLAFSRIQFRIRSQSRLFQKMDAVVCGLYLYHRIQFLSLGSLDALLVMILVISHTTRRL